MRGTLLGGYLPNRKNGDERAIWHDTDEANHSLQIAGNILTLTVKHTSALDAPNFNLLDVTGIDTDSVDVVSDPITLADLPAGTQTLRMIFACLLTMLIRLRL